MSDQKSLQVSCDGMSESKSTTVSMDVYSSKLPNCKAIFPHRIVRPLRKFPIDNNFQLSCFLNDILENDGNIKQFIADNLKRANAKNVLNHASNFPCEYCFCKGVKFKPNSSASEKLSEKQLKEIREKLRKKHGTNIDINELEKEIEAHLKSNTSRTKIVWPASTINAEPRTDAKIQAIVLQIEEGNELTPDEAKGILGRSPLTQIPNFNTVMDTPAEYLHSVCLGVTKRLVILTFNVGEKRTRVTKRKLSNPSIFNAMLREIKLFKEFSRRSRELDPSVMKGQEYRNIAIFFFIIVIKCIPVNNGKEKKLWLLYGYMIRSCILPEKEFKNIDLENIESACARFYKLYEELFGLDNCSYNTHVVIAHLLEIRHHGPLTFTSAFSFESFYGEIRNSFVPGTQSTLKQIFKKILMKRTLTQHTCANSIHYSAHETPLENNSLIYCFKDLSHKFYQITEVHNDYVLCNPQGKKPHTFPDLQNYNFSELGIYAKGLKSDEIVKIPKKKSTEKYFLLTIC